MVFRIAINGYGRIGQSVLRALYASPYRSRLRIVAINELADIQTLTYLTRYDTTHGRFPYKLTHDGNHLIIGEDRIQIFSEKKAAQLPWKDLGIDLLMECSGSFADRETAELHLKRGAKRLLFSQPANPDVDATIVYGYNERDLRAEHAIVSNASCTTNCIVPILQILDQELGIQSGVTTTVHSAMNDQPIIDSYHHTNLRLTRSALHSIIPVETNLAKGIDRLMPLLAGKFECLHLRVPTINVSVMDLSINVKKQTSAGEINRLISRAADSHLKGLVGYTEEPHASVDFNTDTRSSIFDGSQTKVSEGRLIKMLCWFDNEWGFANRMLDVANHWLSLKPNQKK
ncbi:MAG: erythrose-4-phosphate dehydrogenase [Deltaproteobacteria bacterium]|nr:erythrose-4-phosphate dehydrogenase [Deltaproteobacteria bacterium]MBW2659813.1 erythrose-4-phosphate dehydrogenase [Deltaproteobacteria bacterium]